MPKASCPYLPGAGFDGEQHITGHSVPVVDDEACRGPVPNQDIREEELVLVCDEHSLLLLPSLQAWAEAAAAAADLVPLKDGLDVIHHEGCERSGAEGGLSKEKPPAELPCPWGPLTALEKPLLPRQLPNPALARGAACEDAARAP